jgi:hypothetical protein
MSAIKHAFHEVISGEYGAIEALEAEYHMAYEGHKTLHERLPVYRTPEQERQLKTAYEALSWAKWKLDQARFWTAYHEKIHNRGDVT